MNKTPINMRYSIAIVGKTNAGKSSLLNAICEQEISIVSEISGTTTDVVTKAYEFIGFGPIVFYDTAGVDDSSALGEKRKAATFSALEISDMALVVIGDNKISTIEQKLIEQIKSLCIPYIIVYNKNDESNQPPEVDNNNALFVSALYNKNIDKLKQLIFDNAPKEKEERFLEKVIRKNDKIILVIPIDGEAPKGRLILAQVQTIRELLDINAIVISVQPEQLQFVDFSDIKMVIADSQCIADISSTVPKHVKLTTFSILLCKSMYGYETFLDGTDTIDELIDGDKVLISEACSHTTMEDDIARVKIPKLLSAYTGKKLDFYFSQGKGFVNNLSEFRLVVHCGGCMLNSRGIKSRINICQKNNVAITNYGMTISKCVKILERVVL